jgi:hypothetical protein
VKKQTEAVNQIKSFLSNQGVDIKPGKLTLPDGQEWVIFEREGKQIGIDTVSGVWKRSSSDEYWQCIGMPCTVSCAIQAADFLTKE